MISSWRFTRHAVSVPFREFRDVFRVQIFSLEFSRGQQAASNDYVRQQQ